MTLDLITLMNVLAETSELLAIVSDDLLLCACANGNALGTNFSLMYRWSVFAIIYVLIFPVNSSSVKGWCTKRRTLFAKFLEKSNCMHSHKLTIFSFGASALIIERNQFKRICTVTRCLSPGCKNQWSKHGLQTA